MGQLIDHQKKTEAVSAHGVLAVLQTYSVCLSKFLYNSMKALGAIVYMQ